MAEKTTTNKKVDFGTVRVREYQMTLGDNPAVTIGPPVCLSEMYIEADTVPLEDFEKSRAGKRRRPQSRKLKLNYYQRYEILHQAGFEDPGIKAAERGVSRARFKRSVSYYYCCPYIYAGSIKTQLGRRKNKKMLLRKRTAAAQ